MKEITGNIFDHTGTSAICVTTNGCIKSNGALVMGKGLALEFAKKFPKLPLLLGEYVRQFGNHVTWFDRHDLEDYALVFNFPTKEDWREPSTLPLIKRSAIELLAAVEFLDPSHSKLTVVMTRPGCGLGGLNWEDVKKVIEPILDDRFYVITPR